MRRLLCKLLSSRLAPWDLDGISQAAIIPLLSSGPCAHGAYIPYSLCRCSIITAFPKASNVGVPYYSYSIRGPKTLFELCPWGMGASGRRSLAFLPIFSILERRDEQDSQGIILGPSIRMGFRGFLTMSIEKYPPKPYCTL